MTSPTSSSYTDKTTRMPVDTSRPLSSRRSQRKATEDELKDIELKRIRGELSCAECRRLKLKCDKKVPCASCVRRGCESICPCGSLSAGQGARFILADTQQLHRKILEMSNRIRALEDALAILQASVSSERHPLLSDVLLKIKFGAEVIKKDARKKSAGSGEESSGGEGTADYSEEQQTIDALGTLTLDDNSDEVKYFGRSAGSETLLMASEGWAAPSPEDGEAFDDAIDDNAFGFPFSTNSPTSTSSMDPASQSAASASANPLSTVINAQDGSPPLSRLSNLFPFTSPIPPSIWKSGGAGLSEATMRKLHERQNLLDLLYSYLPPRARGHELAESYIQHASYFFRPIKRDELLGEASNLPDMPIPEGNRDPTRPSLSTDAASSGGFLPQVYDAASKRQLHTPDTDCGSPSSSNDDRSEETTPTTSPSSPSSIFSAATPSTATSSQPQTNSIPQATQPTFAPDSERDPAAPHALATLFMIFALGALLDIKNPPYSAEAERYYTLAKSALSLRTIFDFPSVRTAQAVGLMATYHLLAGNKYSRDSAWGLMSLAAKLSQSLGLHRDSARWKFDAVTVQRRRSLFWEIFAADVSHSLALGRPPAIHLSYVDCEYPIDEEATLSNSQEIQYGFWRLKYMFSRDSFNAVAETTLTAKSPSYATVLDLDKKVRELSFPAAFKPYVSKEDGEEEYYSSSLSLRAFYASQYRTVTMIYLHRSFFAQAILDHPENPLLSPFAPSFLTAYRCASIIIKATAHQFDRCAEMAMRLWFLLYHTFSSAVIVGSVVTHSPSSPMASSALLDLGIALDLFKKTATKSRRARIALDVLRKLEDKAARSWSRHCSAIRPTQVRPEPTRTHSSPLSGLNRPTTGFKSSEVDESDDDGGDQLAIFGGQKKVLTRKNRRASSVAPSNSKSSPSYPLSGASPSPPHTSPSPPTVHTEPVISIGDQQPPPNIPPSLMEYVQGNLFDLEIVEDASGGTRTNPFAVANGSSSSSAMQGIKPASLGTRPEPVSSGIITPNMIALAQMITAGNGSGSGVGMGDMYHNTASSFSGRSPVGTMPAAPLYLQHLFAQSPPSTQPPLAIQSEQTAPTWSASTVTDPTCMWPQSGPNSSPVPPSLSGPQELDCGWFMDQDEMFGFAGARPPVPTVFPTAPTAAFGGYGAIDLTALGNGAYPDQAATPGFGGLDIEDLVAAGMMSVDPREDMVEMGLTSESGMDAAWMSFMRDCGIMEYGDGPQLAM